MQLNIDELKKLSLADLKSRALAAVLTLTANKTGISAGEVQTHLIQQATGDNELIGDYTKAINEAFHKRRVERALRQLRKGGLLEQTSTRPVLYTMTDKGAKVLEGDGEIPIIRKGDVVAPAPKKATGKKASKKAASRKKGSRKKKAPITKAQAEQINEALDEYEVADELKIDTDKLS